MNRVPSQVLGPKDLIEISSEYTPMNFALTGSEPKDLIEISSEYTQTNFALTGSEPKDLIEISSEYTQTNFPSKKTVSPPTLMTFLPLLRLLLQRLQKRRL